MNLDRNEFSKPDQIYEFLYKSAVCASKLERSKITDSEKETGEPSNKKRRFSSNPALLLNTPRNCVACEAKRHPLYMCEKFKKLPIPKRIELVRAEKVCYNCLRSHRDNPCKFSNCTICRRRHNILLHFENYPTTCKSSLAKPETTQRD